MTDRALSTVLNYVLVLGIMAVLTSGLLIGVSGVVENQQETAVRSELEVVGQRLASDLGTADRLVRMGDAPSTVALTTDYPRRMVESTYRITIADAEGENRYRLRLTSTDPAVSVTATLRLQTPLSTGTVYGGTLRITSDDGESLEVTRV